jgi:4-amino-4-deoxy-L-arabinose transferase-like glycosyltransferase
VSWFRRDATQLVLLIVIVAGLNLLWAAIDSRPPHWDKAIHLSHTLDLYGAFSVARLFDWLGTYTYYPPLAYWIADVFYVVGQSTDPRIAVASQVPFLATLVLATYGIGARLWSGRVGVLSALFVATSPMVTSAFKDYMLDGPLVAMTALSLYLLIRTEDFSVRSYSLLFGLACGLAVLTKWSFAFAILLPGVVAVAAALVLLVRARAWQRLANLAGGGALALLVGAPWFWRNFTQLAGDYRNNIAAAFQIEGDPAVFSAPSLLYYFWTLVTHQLWVLPFLLFVCGLVLLGRRDRAIRTNRYPLLLIAGCFVAFTLVGNKDPRFTMPMLPAVAVVATYWIDGLRPVWRSAVSGVTAAYCAGTFLAVSFGTPLLPKDLFVTLPSSPFVSGLPDFKPNGDIVTVHGVRVWAQQSYPLGAPSDEQWYQEEMFKEAARRSVTRTIWFQGPNVDTIWFNVFAMHYFSLRYRVTWVATLPQTDFAAVRTLAGQSAVAPSGFEQIREFSLPDGGGLRLYRRHDLARTGELRMTRAHLAPQR